MWDEFDIITPSIKDNSWTNSYIYLSHYAVLTFLKDCFLLTLKHVCFIVCVVRMIIVFLNRLTRELFRARLLVLLVRKVNSSGIAWC